MKKILLFVIAFVTLSVGCMAQQGFKATGTVKGFRTENVYLITYPNNLPDTLAKAAVVDGKFQFSGEVKDVIVGYLFMEGDRNGFQIFLENNTSYTISFDSSSPAANHVEGGTEQKRYNEFRAITMEVMQKQQEIQQAFSQVAKDSVRREELNKAYRKAYDDYQVQLLDFFKRNSDSYAAAYVVVSIRTQIPFEKLKEYYALLGENAKKTDMGVLLTDHIRTIEQLAIGQVAPDFELTTPEGKKFSLHKVKGKVKLLDFWASWCGPCRKENPNVRAIYDEFHDKGLEIVGVSLDGKKEDWVKAIKEDELPWIQGSDLKGNMSDVARLYNVTRIPQTFLLDENNRIVAKDLRGEDLKAKIAELLK